MSTTQVALELEEVSNSPPHRQSSQEQHRLNSSIVELSSDPVPRASAAQVPSGRIFEAVQPAIVTTTSQQSRLLITSLIVAANIIQFASTNVTVTGGIALSRLLIKDTPTDQANWLAAAYSLTQGAFVLITGRLGAIYGHNRLILIGLAVFSISSLVNAFCRWQGLFIALRAFTGIGGGIFMPNAVATIMLMVPPGRARNLLMGLFASSPPIGGCLGAILAGSAAESGEFKSWSILFVCIAAASFICLVWLWIVLPKENPVDKSGKIDYIGASLGLSSLLLFSFVWNQAPSVGWKAPSEIAIVCVSFILFTLFIIWSSSGFAAEPIMPLSIFAAPTFTALIFVVLLSYMVVGTVIWYISAWQQTFRGLSVLQIGINFLPFGIAALAAVALSAYMLPRIAAQWIMAVGVAFACASSLLLATQPVEQTYWAQTFPAIILIGFCPDFVYLAAQIIASNSVSRKHQGVASSLVGTLNLYGNSLGLGVAATVETEVIKNDAGGGAVDVLGKVPGFRAALYFGAGIAAVSLALNFAFVRVPKNDREGWDEEEEEEEQVEGGFEETGFATAVERPPQAV